MTTVTTVTSESVTVAIVIFSGHVDDSEDTSNSSRSGDSVTVERRTGFAFLFSHLRGAVVVLLADLFRFLSKQHHQTFASECSENNTM